MASLPSDVIGVIAAFLYPNTDTQEPLMLVCSTWFQGVLSQDGMKPKPQIRWPLCALAERGAPMVQLTDTHRGDSDKQLALLAAEHPQVNGIAISGATDAGMDQIASLNSLTTLKLHRCARVTDYGITSLCGLENLESLEVRECFKITNSSLIKVLAANKGQTTSLKVLDCGQVNENVFVSASRHGILDNLLTLAWSHLTIDENTKLTQFSTSTISHLATLHLEHCEISTAGARSIASSFRQLTTLCLQFSEFENEALNHLLSNLEQLTSLDLSHSDYFSGNGLRTLKRLRFLKNLNLSHCCVGDVGLKNISDASQKYQTLTALNVSYSRCQVTNVGLPFIAAIKSLKSLAMERCSALSDVEVESHIATKLTQLTTLKLGGCPMTDVGVSHISKGLPALRILSLNRTEMLTDKSFVHLENLKHLAELEILDCDRITLRGLWDLTTKMPHLQVSESFMLSAACGNTEHATNPFFSSMMSGK